MPKGSIVLVPFPFDDSIGSKPRPALCLTEPIGPHGHVILAFISSQLPEALDWEPSDMRISSGVPWFEQTGLKDSSVLRLHRLTTAASQFIRRELGFLPPTQLKSALIRVKKLFDDE